MSREPITARFKGAWAVLRGMLAPGTAAPLPGGRGGGQYASWAQMLATFASQYQPISPAEAKEGTDNSIVDICINWIATSWSTTTPQVGKQIGDYFEPVAGEREHWLVTLLNQPNEDMDGATFLWALLQDYITRGNAYAHIIHSRSGIPASLEYLPARCMEPIPNSLGRLDHYKYTVDGQVIEIAKDDVVNIRHGVDPNMLLLGRSPLAAQYREIVADNRASDWAAGLLKAGIPQVLFTPRAVGDGSVSMTRDEARDISQALNEKFAAEPGRPRVLPGALEMHRTGLSPAEMAINDARAEPETRIAAALGLPPLVLGLLSAIQKSTFSNYEMATRQAWQGCILPMMSVFASAFTRQVLYLNPADKSKGLSLRWDTSGVPELQADMNTLRTAAREDVKVGVLTIDEARQQQGLDPMPTSDVPSPAPLPAVDPATKAARLLKVSTPPKGSIYSAADAYRRALLADETQALDALAADWNRAIAETQQRLNSIPKYLQSAEDEGIAIDARLTETANRLSDLLPQMEAQLSQLSDRGAAIIESGQRAMILTAIEGASAMATAQNINAWNTLPAESFEALAGFASDGSPLTSLLDSAFADYADAVRTRLLTAIAQGKNPRQVAATIAAITGESRSRVESICRTEMLRANREATRRTYQANRDVLEGWTRLSAADARTCPACWALHGQIHHTDDIMPSHVNCRCVMVPNPRAVNGEPMGTPIPAGEDIFSALSEADQIEILGPGRYEQWKQGAPFSSFADVSNDPTWGPTVATRPVSAPTPMEAPV